MSKNEEKKPTKELKKSASKVIAENYHPEYMQRPLIHKVYSKFIFALVISMAWFRLLDRGTRGLGFVFTVMGVLFLIAAWFNYLALDGVKIGHLMEGWQRKNPRTVRFNKDIIDFVDEEVIDYDELADDERRVIRLYSNLILGALYIILSYVVPLFLR